MLNFLVHRVWILENNSKIFNNYFKQFNLIYVSNYLSSIICKKDIYIYIYIYIHTHSLFLVFSKEIELGPYDVSVDLGPLSHQLWTFLIVGRGVTLKYTWWSMAIWILMSFRVVAWSLVLCLIGFSMATKCSDSPNARLLYSPISKLCIVFLFLSVKR